MRREALYRVSTWCTGCTTGAAFAGLIATTVGIQTSEPAVWAFLLGVGVLVTLCRVAGWVAARFQVVPREDRDA